MCVLCCVCTRAILCVCVLWVSVYVSICLCVYGSIYIWTYVFVGYLGVSAGVCIFVKELMYVRLCGCLRARIRLCINVDSVRV